EPARSGPRVVAVDRQVARVGVEGRRDDAQQRGLAGAVRPEQPGHPGAERERHVVEGRGAAVPQRQVGRAQGVGGRGGGQRDLLWWGRTESKATTRLRRPTAAAAAPTATTAWPTGEKSTGPVAATTASHPAPVTDVATTGPSRELSSSAAVTSPSEGRN